MNFGVTMPIKQLLDQVDDDKKKAIIDAILHYRKEYKRAGKELNDAERADVFQKLVQTSLSQISYKEKGVSCGNGCSFCCHIAVDITKGEAELIKMYCHENNIEIPYEYFKAQENYTKENWHELIKTKQSGCGFLSEAGECKVYEVRPIACRKYMVLDPPEKCEYDPSLPEGGRIKNLVDWDAEIIQAAIMNESEFDSIPKMMLK